MPAHLPVMRHSIATNSIVLARHAPNGSSAARDRRRTELQRRDLRCLRHAREDTRPGTTPRLEPSLLAPAGRQTRQRLRLGHRPARSLALPAHKFTRHARLGAEMVCAGWALVPPHPHASALVSWTDTSACPLDACQADGRRELRSRPRWVPQG